MAIQLSKGQGINLAKNAPALQRIRVGIGWDAPPLQNGYPYDLDVSAFVCQLNPAGEPKLISDEHFVFYNNKQTPNGSVQHSGDNRSGVGDGDDELINVDLAKLEAQVSEISFVITLHEASARKQTFGQVRNAYIRLHDDINNTLLAGFNLEEQFINETAVQFGSLFRKQDGWHFQAVGAGYRLELGDFVNGYQ